MTTQKIYFAIAILTLFPLLALWFAILKNKKKRISKIIISLIATVFIFASLTVYFNFWKFHPIYVDDSATNEKIELRRPFHWHEIYHYYIGSKYFSELGYFGTYNCVAMADEERGRLIGVDYVRNLRNVLSSISRNEALHDCEKNFKIFFTADRWSEFQNDLIFLGSIGVPEWWNTAVEDAGFNSPPSSVIFSSSLSNIIPLSSKTYLLIPILDILLLVFACFLIWRNFGIIALCGFVVIFGASHIASYGWNGGSFLRYFWLFNLILGMSFLQKKRYFWSGLFFGVSAMLRVFPIFFALGVAAHLLFNSRKNKKIFRNFILGNAVAFIVLGILSLLIFGFEAWRDFFQNIMLHKDIHYVFHIGLRKIATFADWVSNQNFHGEGGLQVFEFWNRELWIAWQEKLWFYFPLTIFVATAVFVAARKINLIESALLVGVTLIFLSSLPANYYYVFLALIPLSLYSQKQNWRKHLVSFGLFIFLIFTWLTPLMTEDFIVQNFYICCALAIFIIWWVLLCLLPFSFLKKNFKFPHA